MNYIKLSSAMSVLIVFLFISISVITSPILSNACNDLYPSLENDLNKFGIPGISIAIKLPDGKFIQCQAGVKSIKTHKPITENTLFQIGSVTKTFVSALVLLQVQTGKLSLDETIGDAVKRYGVWLPKAAKK